MSLTPKFLFKAVLFKGMDCHIQFWFPNASLAAQVVTKLIKSEEVSNYLGATVKQEKEYDSGEYSCSLYIKDSFYDPEDVWYSIQSFLNAIYTDVEFSRYITPYNIN